MLNLGKEIAAVDIDVPEHKSLSVLAKIGKNTKWLSKYLYWIKVFVGPKAKRIIDGLITLLAAAEAQYEKEKKDIEEWKLTS